MALYNLSKEIDKKRFKDRVNTLYEKSAVVELIEKKPRSLSQNNYFHLIVGWFAFEYGASELFVKEEYFKRLVNSEIFLIQKKSKTGVDFEELRSSTELNSAEMTIAIERFRNWSGQEGIYLPAPNEQDFLREIQIEISRNYY